MPKSQLAGKCSNQENMKNSMQRPCPLNQNYARKSGRPALANVQIEASHGQHLTVDYRKKIESKPALNNLLHPQPNLGIRRSNSCRCPTTRLSTSGLIKSEKEETTSSHRGRHFGYQSKNDDVFLHPNSAKKGANVRSSSQPRISLYTDENTATTIHGTTKRSTSQSRIPFSTGSSKTHSNAVTTQPTNDQHKSWRSFKSVSSMYFGDSQVQRCDINSITKVELPNQHFVTLSQDSFKTVKSELDSVTSIMSKVQLTRDTSFVAVGEKTFVDGEKFFYELDNGKSSTIRSISLRSPCSINFPLRRSSSFSNIAEPKPAVKLTLKRRSSTKKEIAFPLLYSPDYSEDLLSYSYNHRNNFLLKREWVDMYLDKRERTNVVNWLLINSEFIVPHFEPVYYMAVRLLDHSIIQLKLRNNRYQLAAITAFWISLKYLDITVILKVSKIFSLCGGKYSKAEILSMERKILKSVDFCLNIADPMDFLHHYLRSSEFEFEFQLMEHGAKFVLECATLCETYPLVDASFLAANALYMAYKKVSKTYENDLNFKLYDKRSIQNYNDKILKVNVRRIIAEKYEPLSKYMTSEKMYVAKLFFDI